jgi:hypothetical protein
VEEYPLLRLLRSPLAPRLLGSTHVIYAIFCQEMDVSESCRKDYGKQSVIQGHKGRIDDITKPTTKRIPKQNAPPIEISKPSQWNNGNVEVIESELPTKEVGENVDEVLINGRRFRVPERIILLDFWAKVSRNNGRTAEYVSSV